MNPSESWRVHTCWKSRTVHGMTVFSEFSLPLVMFRSCNVWPGYGVLLQSHSRPSSKWGLCGGCGHSCHGNAPLLGAAAVWKRGRHRWWNSTYKVKWVQCFLYFILCVFRCICVCLCVCVCVCVCARARARLCVSIVHLDISVKKFTFWQVLWVFDYTFLQGWFWKLLLFVIYIDLISRGRENTGDCFPSLHIDRGAAEVNMAREIIKPVFSRPREIRVLSQEDWLVHHWLVLLLEKVPDESVVSLCSECYNASTGSPWPSGPK